MKPFYLILLLLCGCSAVPRAVIPPGAHMQAPGKPVLQPTIKYSLTVGSALSDTEESSVSSALPRPITWTWNPGGYSNFVVVTSTELTTPLLQWPTYAITTDTNFQAFADESQRFFSLYGTNAVTGENAWVEK